ncbi:MAG: autotransporter assembly complex protein TamA [Desulfuromusa sp.]|nr:autotransporter assembly complex protein TamA [Desulfuromusa sp.]
MKSFFYLLLFCLLLLPVPCSAESLYLNIQGIDSELQKILETALVLPSSLTSGDEINKRWLRRYQKQLPELVSGILEPYGYFHSQVSSLIEQIEPGEYQLNIDISPDEPLRVTNLELNLTGPGADLPELRQVLAEFPLQTDNILRQDLYEAGKTALLKGAVNLGYLDAGFRQHQILVDRGKRKVDIILRLDSGVRYRFGKTLFVGRGSYPERFLNRYLSYSEGEYFSHNQLGQTQLNLLNADLFRSISIHPLTDQKEADLMPVQIDLQPAPRHRLRPGIGYGTDTGVRGSLRYRNLNLLHRGHELQGELVLAEKKQSILSTYIIPDLDRLDSQTLLRVGVDREETDSYLSRELFSEGEYQRSFRKSLTGSLFVRLSQEHSRIGDETNRSQMLLPGVRLSWRQVDDPLTPRRGIQASLKLQGSHNALLSDTSLLQLSGQITALRPLPRQYSLLLRLRGGTTWHNDPFNGLPASLRFFAGGDRSVRGYSYQSLGPTDDQGQVIGGKHLLVANLELEKRLNPNWGIAVFYDIGNAFDSLSDYELEQGAGIGVSRYTRIGPLRLDLARQIGKAKNKYRLHVSVGFGW